MNSETPQRWVAYPGRTEDEVDADEDGDRFERGLERRGER